MKKVEIKQFDNIVKWFESVYRGNPVVIDLKNKDGSYRCTITYTKRRMDEV